MTPESPPKKSPPKNKLYQLLERQRTQVMTLRRNSNMSKAFADHQANRLKRTSTQGAFAAALTTGLVRRDTRGDSFVSGDSGYANVAWGAMAGARMSRKSILSSALGTQSRRVSDGMKRRLKMLTGRSSAGEDSMVETTDDEAVNTNIRPGFEVMLCVI